MYSPNINPAPYSTAWLEGRANLLLTRQTTGTHAQRASPKIAAELAVITLELATRKNGRPAKRLPVPRDLNRNRLDVAPAADVAVAPWQPYTPTLAPRPVGGYTGAVRSVTADFNPAHNSQYR